MARRSQFRPFKEEAEQRSLLRWWSLAHRGLGVGDERLLFHIPNGGKRALSEARRLKGAGVRAGVPDLFLSVARKGHHGLFIEMKRRDGFGAVSPEQAAFCHLLNLENYRVVVCEGWEQAQQVIESYLLP